MKLIRQGDVMLRPVGDIPAAAKPREPVKSLTVALGEVTGHSHVLEAPQIVEYHDPDLERRFLEIVEGAGLLVHDEHTALEVPPGRYEVVIQREFTETAAHQVCD